MCSSDLNNIEEHLTKLKGAWEYLVGLQAEDFIVSNIQFKALVASSLPLSWDTITNSYVGCQKGEKVDEKKNTSSQEFMGAIREEFHHRQAIMA